MYIIFIQASNFILILFCLVNKSKLAILQVVFLPLLTFEVTIIVDNFRVTILSFGLVSTPAPLAILPLSDSKYLTILALFSTS
uniref:Uncharacterized protein n=1 Tax=Lactuca sativa TaxID=4236 RepID=A0A9R1XUU1_LACSA|nr:hypothetical protein LSAT_V11C200099680 [Lactuca sativa]